MFKSYLLYEMQEVEFSGSILSDRGFTSRKLLNKHHKELMKEAEKSMKETATSCTVVTAFAFGCNSLYCCSCNFSYRYFSLFFHNFSNDIFENPHITLQIA